jgi:hypothetical protein
VQTSGPLCLFSCDGEVGGERPNKEMKPAPLWRRSSSRALCEHRRRVETDR